MFTLEECENFSSEELSNCLLPMDILLEHFPILTLSEYDLQRLYLGQPIILDENIAEGCVRLYDENANFQGLAEWDPLTTVLKPKRLLANPEC
jgi:tRNA U55 pseudouridine synthase TruB